MATETEKHTFTVDFEGIALSDDQKHTIEDSIMTSVRHVLTEMQLDKAADVLKSSDALSPEGLAGEGDPPRTMGGTVRRGGGGGPK
ncbi:hypothetical protein [Streptomyces sp. NPDC056240]|uniref:hypothetical protein n=1 Tax=Streptomyces sp. NPDC056240 TaxID=3345759 RepID=UPI0035D9F150